MADETPPTDAAPVPAPAPDPPSKIYSTKTIAEQAAPILEQLRTLRDSIVNETEANAGQRGGLDVAIRELENVTKGGA